MTQEEFLTVKEVADILKFHEDTVKRLLRENKLPGYKIAGGVWRVSRSDLNEYLARIKNIQDKN